MSVKELISKYLDESKSQVAETTYNIQKAYMMVFARFVGEEKEEIIKQDIINFLNSDSFISLNDNSQNKVKLYLKRFFNWLNFDTGILLKGKKTIKNELKKSDLITKEEFKEILKSFDNPLDKAFFSLLMESAARKNELLNMKIKDITFYDSYAMIYIKKSKTAQRNIPIVESIPFITRYLENHPLRDDPDAWLFGHYYKGEFRRFANTFCNDKLRMRLENKRLYPHLFRHTALSRYAKHFTEFQLKQLGGLAMDSKMVARYVHLSNEDLESKMLELHGLKLPTPEEKITNMELIKCPRCEYVNSEIDKYCSRCGSALNLKVVLEQKELANFAVDKYSLPELRDYIKSLENSLDEIKKRLSK